MLTPASTSMLIYSHAHTPACSQKHIHMHDVYADTSIQAQVHACTDMLALIHILVFLWCNVFRLILDSFFFHASRFLDISLVQLKMPNIHFLPVNLKNKDNETIVKV
jgi:hypothetical protein